MSLFHSVFSHFLLHVCLHNYLYVWLSICVSSEEVTSSGKLKVIPSVNPLFTRKLDVLEVIEGRNARFDCKVSGTPPPNVTWSHFGNIISYGSFKMSVQTETETNLPCLYL